MWSGGGGGGGGGTVKRGTFNPFQACYWPPSNFLVTRPESESGFC